MKTKKKPNGFWTKEECRKKAFRYIYKSDFMKAYPGAYGAAHRAGFLDDICKHMKYKVKKTSLSKTDVLKRAKKYKTRKEFERQDPKAYRSARTHNCLNEACAHMKLQIKPSNYWRKKENIIKAVNKCDYKNEFRLKFPSAYDAARKMEIWDEIKKNFKIVGNRMERYIYAFEFPDKSVYVGLTYNYALRTKQHLQRTKSIKEKIIQFKGKYRFYEEGKLYPPEQAIKAEARLMKSYKKRGWELLNIKSAGSVGSGYNKWNQDKIIKVAKKYNSRTEFYKRNPSAYHASIKAGIHEETCKHMKIKKLKKGFWTEEKIIKKARSFKTISSFKKGFPGAYNAARRFKIDKQLKQYFKK